MGVFVPCLQNILGTLYFLRLSWIVALQGISNSLLLVGIACTTTLMTSLSLSAIATNGAMKAGGPYYLISRALGPEFGGSVGLCFYLGTTVAGAMYVLGTAEPLLLSFPGLQICGLDPLGELPTWNIVVYGYLILAFCATVITLGVKYVSKISPAFLVCVLISIFLIWVGMLAGDREIRAEVLDASCSEDGESSNASAVGLLALGGVNATIDSGRVLMPLIGAPSRANIDANWKFDELIEDDECTDAGYDCDFVFGLALFFPSVTGIMAGSNRSGDLKDAQHSIPLGTLAATLCTSVLYLLTTFMFGAVANRDVLADKNSVLLAAVVSWPSEYVVRVGVVLSALGAALQSLTGAPRLLQAIANDNLIPILRPFRGTGEPRKPLALTIVICAAFISTGNVNSVAPIITMFFLLCYAFVNAACLLQDVLQEPNWRPRFRFYHPATSATGLGLCLFIMFYTRWYFALASIMMVIALYGYIQYRKVEAQWGDGLQGLRYHQARKSLEELEKLDGASHIKNWRPQVLILCKPDARKQGAAHPKLIALLKQLKGARGLSIVGSIVPGRLAESAKVQATMDRALRRLRDENKVQGFTQVIMTPNVTLGLSSLIQTSGLGGLYPNTVMLGWSRHWKERTERAQQMTTLLLTASAYNQAIVVVKGMEHIPDGGARMTRPMDIWWMVHDGGLQLLLATILRRGRVWATCTLRVFCVLQYGEDPDELQKKVVEFLYQMRIDAEVKCVVLSEGAALVDRPGLAASKLGSALGGGTSDGKPGKKPKEVAWQLNSAIVGAGPIGDLDLSEPGFDEESVNMRRAERRGSAGATVVDERASLGGDGKSVSLLRQATASTQRESRITLAALMTGRPPAWRGLGAGRPLTAVPRPAGNPLSSHTPSFHPPPSPIAPLPRDAGEISPSMARSASGLLQRSNSAGASILSPKRGKQNNGNIFAAAAAQAVAACEAAAASSSSSTDDARGDRSRAELASTDPGPKRHEPRWPEERAPVSRKASFVNARELVDTTQVEMMETQLEVEVEDDNGGAPAAAAPAAAPAGAPGPAEEVRRPSRAASPSRYTKEEGEDTEEDECPCESQRRHWPEAGSAARLGAARGGGRVDRDGQRRAAPPGRCSRLASVCVVSPLRRRRRCSRRASSTGSSSSTRRTPRSS